VTGSAYVVFVLELSLLLAAMYVVGTAVARTARAAERLAAGLIAVLGLAWAAMAQPIAGVSVIGHPAVDRVVLLVAVGGLSWWRRRDLLPAAIDPLPLFTGIAAGVLVALPELLQPAANYGGDMLWHEGWLRQVASGALEPTGLYSGVPNSYPWMYHSLGAWLMTVGGGGMASTLLLLELIMLLALGLGVWLLARELGLGRAAGTWSMLLGVAGGGFGVVGQLATRSFDGRSLAFPPATPAIYGAPPALPRDWGLAIVPMVMWLTLRGLRAADTRLLAVAGAVAGFAFLFAPPSGLVVTAIAVATGSALRSVRAVLATAAAAAIVAGIWLLPLAWHFHQLGGFVRLSDINPPGLSVGHAVVDLGVTLPLGVAGLVLARSRLDPLARRALISGVAVSAAAWTLAALVPAGARFNVPQFESEIRYLPMLMLTLTLPAGLAAATLVDAVRGRGRLVAVAALVVVSTASTAGAAAYQTRQESERGQVQQRGFGCTPAVGIRGLETVATVDANRWVALTAFSATGAYSLFTPTPRIRYRDPFRHIETQGHRRQALQRIVAGERPPAGVAWVLSRSTKPLSNTYLRQVATCETVNVTLTLYRVQP
jgi:hypothetical protein